MMKHRKIVAAVGVTAALATGGVIGATLGIPNISGAQDSPTTTTAPEASPRGGHAAMGPFRGAGLGSNLEAAAKALGLTVDELRTAMKDGKTLADVAADQGVDKQQVVDALLADAIAMQDERVADGTITQEQADRQAQKVNERVTACVNGEGFGGGIGHHGGHGHGHGDASTPGDNGADDRDN